VIYLSQYLTNLMHKNSFYNKFYFMPLHVSSTCAYHQDIKIVLHSLWYYYTYRWPSRARVHYRCYDTRGCVIQFWYPDDKHVCSKHVEAWNKTHCKTNFCASSCLNTEINILRCTVSKTSKFFYIVACWDCWRQLRTVHSRAFWV